MSNGLKQDISIGGNLKALRKRARLSQREAAAQLEVLGVLMSEDILAKIEQGRYSVRISALLALKQIYDALLLRESLMARIPGRNPKRGPQAPFGRRRETPEAGAVRMPPLLPAFCLLLPLLAKVSLPADRSTPAPAINQFFSLN